MFVAGIYIVECKRGVFIEPCKRAMPIVRLPLFARMTFLKMHLRQPDKVFRGKIDYYGC
jgi:hypothetical protein